MSDDGTRGGLRPGSQTLRSLTTPRWAVLVGVSEYRAPSLHLRYAHRDVEELWKVLQTQACGRFVEERAQILVNEKATTQSVTRALRSFLQQAGEDDLVLVYLSGHSAPDPKRRNVIYFLTHDTDPGDIAGSALPMREVLQSLDENLDARRVILLMDTCHSAAVNGGKGAAESDSTALDRYLIELQGSKDGFALFTSSEAGEQSREHARWGGGHGLFTHLILEGLRGKADTNNNGIVTLGELFDYVTQQTPVVGGRGAQHPHVGSRPFDRNLVVAVTGGADARDRLDVGRQIYQMAVELGDRRRFAAAARHLSEADDLASVERGLPEARMLAGLAHIGAGDPEAACRELHGRSMAASVRARRGNQGVCKRGTTWELHLRARAPETKQRRRSRGSRRSMPTAAGRRWHAGSPRCCAANATSSAGAAHC